MDELKNIVSRVTAAIQSDRVKRTALTTVLAVQKPRIFEKGQDESGGQIGTYSTKPISIARSKQARNTGKTYFKGGYSEYKTAVGKNPGYVNLTNTGQMAADYTLIKTGEGYGFGFQNDFNADKMGWQEDKYKKGIAKVTDKELDLFGEILVNELNKAI